MNSADRVMKCSGRGFESTQRFSHLEQNKYARIMPDSLTDIVVIGGLNPHE